MVNWRAMLLAYKYKKHAHVHIKKPRSADFIYVLEQITVIVFIKITNF